MKFRDEVAKSTDGAYEQKIFENPRRKPIFEINPKR